MNHYHNFISGVCKCGHIANKGAQRLGKRNKGVKKTLSPDRLIQLRVQAGVMRKAKLALTESTKS